MAQMVEHAGPDVADILVESDIDTGHHDTVVFNSQTAQMIHIGRPIIVHELFVIVCD